MKTCGELFKQAMERYCTTRMGSGPVLSLDLLKAFVAGFVNGQAEKVFLGACKAAMFRMSEDRKDAGMEIVEDACRRYGLVWSEGGYPGEVWVMLSENSTEVLEQLHKWEPNSEAWHIVRGRLCGVPLGKIDPLYHEREKHHERCD